MPTRPVWLSVRHEAIDTFQRDCPAEVFIYLITLGIAGQAANPFRAPLAGCSSRRAESMSYYGPARMCIAIAQRFTVFVAG